jgi:hypothetical protein
MLKDLRKLRAMYRQGHLFNQTVALWALLELLIPPYDYELLPECFRTYFGP